MFGDAQNFPVGEGPVSVTSADFDGDGKKDVAVANFGNYPGILWEEIPGGISVLLGDGQGALQPKRDFEVATNRHPQSVTSAHFNDDGEAGNHDDDLADLVVPNPASDDVSVFLSNGDGSFQGAKSVPAGDTPRHATSGDFDGDGNADLAVANETSDDVSVLLGRGDGTFQDARGFSAGDAPSSVIHADFSGDGKADLAVLRRSSDDVSVLLGRGDGTFQDAKSVPVEDETTSVSSADLNGDNKADLATAHRPSFGSTASPTEGVSVFLSNGDGSFQAGKSFPVSWNDGYRRNPEHVITADLDGDKKQDFATANRGAFWTGDYGVSVLLGKGDGTFQEAQEYPYPFGTQSSFPSSLTAANLNADDFADLAVANEGSNDYNFEKFPDDVSVLVNNSVASDPAPPETSIDSGPTGTVNSGSATFEFSSLEASSSFECSLDDSAWAECISPKTVPDEGTLTDGSHTFMVRATDAATGTTDPTPASSTWWVDTTDPDTTIGSTKPANPTNSTSASFSFSSSESNSTFRCKLDNGDYEDCSSTTQYTSLTQGSHTFSVKAIDQASNEDETPPSYTWTVDTSAPTVGSVTPSNSATGVIRTTTVTASFSEAMNPATLTAITFRLTKQGSTTPIAAAVSYDATTNKVTLKPSSSLAANTKYTATVKGGTSGAKDKAGNPLASNKVWSFTTGKR